MEIVQNLSPPAYASAFMILSNTADRCGQGYANSGLDLRVELFCHELATISDNSSNLLGDFARMKASKEQLRNSADAAALLVLNYRYCGMAWGATYSNGNTFSVTMKVMYLDLVSFLSFKLSTYVCSPAPWATTASVTRSVTTSGCSTTRRARLLCRRSSRTGTGTSSSPAPTPPGGTGRCWPTERRDTAGGSTTTPTPRCPDITR